MRLPKDDERHERFGKVQNRPLYIAPGGGRQRFAEKTEVGWSGLGGWKFQA